MIALAEQLAKDRMPRDAGHKYAYDTGARFNGTVKVRLLTADPARAEQLGWSLASKGMPGEIPERLVRPSIAVLPIILALDKMTNQPVFLRWPNQQFGDLVVLETTDKMLREPFLRFLDDHYREPPKPKPVNLSDMADAGEIETFDAG